MRSKTFKRHLMTIAFMLFCICINAADKLITNQVTIRLDKAGTLPSKISDNEKYQITNLKIIGDINGTDVRLIRDMAGADTEGKETAGNLSTLDLSEANIVDGGELYYFSGFGTHDNIIGEYFFLKCNKLTSVTLPSVVEWIDNCAFDRCSSLVSLEIPFGVTSIGCYAFRECSSLASVTIPSSVTSIGESAFIRCSSLTSVNIPSSITKIAQQLFSGCSSLTSMTIPSGVTSIERNAFHRCI